MSLILYLLTLLKTDCELPKSRHAALGNTLLQFKMTFRDYQIYFLTSLSGFSEKQIFPALLKFRYKTHDYTGSIS